MSQKNCSVPNFDSKMIILPMKSGKAYTCKQSCIEEFGRPPTIFAYRGKMLFALDAFLGTMSLLSLGMLQVGSQIFLGLSKAA